MSAPHGTPSSGAGPVVICCATPDRDELQPVVRELEQAGQTVEIVSGVENDAELLAAVIDRCHGEGLYVLVRSRSLGREVVDELREVLLARHVPFGRTLTVASKRHRELLERIRTGLKRVAAGRARRMSKVPVEGAPRRHPTMVGIPVPKKPQPAESKPAAEPAATPRRHPTQVGIPVQDVAKLASETSKAISTDRPTAGAPAPTGLSVPLDPEDFEDDVPTSVNAPVAKAQRSAKRPPSPPPPPQPKAAARQRQDPAPAKAGIPAVPAGRPEDSLGSVELIKPEDLADLGQSADNLPIIEDPGSGDLHRALITGNTAVVDLNELAARAGNTVRSAAPSAPSPGSAPSSSSIQRPDPPPAAPSYDMPPVEAAPSSDFQPASALPATDTSFGGADALGGPQVAATASTRRAGPPWLAIGGIAAVLVLGLGTAAFLALDDDEDDEVAKADTEPEPEPEPKPEPEPEPEPIVGKEPGLARTKVMEALRARTVRALDILLVTNETAGPMPYPDAASHCNGLDVAGLAGWRLPEVGELSSLDEAGMLGRGFYWSATAADTFGDVRLSWWGRRSRIVQRDRDAYVLCVRGNREAD